MALSLSAIVFLQTAAADEFVPPSHAVVTAAQAQLEAGELETAVELASRSVESIENRGRPYDIALVKSYRVLGDAELALGHEREAIQAFERARSELRMLDGLHVPTQLDLLYREAAAYRGIDDIKSANARHEYAFDIQRHSSPTNEIDATIRLAGWYEQNRYESTARDLYREALELVEIHAPDDLTTKGRLLRKIASTYRSQFYPGTKANDPKPSRKVLTPRPYGTLWRDIERLSADPWGVEQTLRARISLQRSRDAFVQVQPVPLEELVLTLRDLGDWYLLTRKYGPAFATYRDLHALLLAHDHETARADLRQPALLHMRYPEIPGYVREGAVTPTSGYIEAEVSVNRLGDVRHLRTVKVDPPRLSDRRFRAALRKARFRPAIVDGEPTTSHNVRVTHTWD
jgi:tetratricopeptide (TPR) repeat protein